MNYSETIPSKRLARLVRCFWSLQHPKTGVHSAPEPVLPDGCVELIFNLADPFVRHHADGTIETQPGAMVAGQMCGPALIGPSGEVDLFGIRFHHAGAYPFFDAPPGAPRERISLTRSWVWPESASPDAAKLA